LDTHKRGTKSVTAVVGGNEMYLLDNLLLIVYVRYWDLFRLFSTFILPTKKLKP